jgi:hypothetical protein
MPPFIDEVDREETGCIHVEDADVSAGDGGEAEQHFPLEWDFMIRHTMNE